MNQELSRSFQRFAAGIAFVIAGCGVAADAPPATGDGQRDSFAVVELFTSEGCSSCPPADALLRDVVADAREHHRPVYALSFHVDYWNRLGWVDKYSSAAFSRRQEAYERRERRGDVYTPQMIVNGGDGFLGSDRETEQRLVKEALAREPLATVRLTVERAKEKTLGVKYEVAGTTDHCVLNLALVQRGVVTEVKRGENDGKTLRHDNVVRWFKAFGLDRARSGEVKIPLPDGADPRDCSVIGYVQQMPGMGIVGASGAD